MDSLIVTLGDVIVLEEELLGDEKDTLKEKEVKVDVPANFEVASGVKLTVEVVDESGNIASASVSVNIVEPEEEVPHRRDARAVAALCVRGRQPERRA